MRVKQVEKYRENSVMDSKLCKIPVLARTTNIKARKDEKPQTAALTIDKRQEEADDNCGQLEKMSYDSMRSLVERRDRDLDELREFANIERESLECMLQEQKCQLLEQQQQIDSHMKKQEEASDISPKSGINVEEERSVIGLTDSNKVNNDIFLLPHCLSLFKWVTQATDCIVPMI